MAKLAIKDDCLAPEKYIYLNYSGPNPYEIVKKIAGSFNAFFHVSSSKVCEYDFRWDRMGDPIGFFNRWWVKKEYSKYTTAWFHFQVQGKQAREGKEGEFRMEISSEIRTDVGSRNPLFMLLWDIYSYSFYNRRRREYIRKCANMATSFRDEMKNHFNLQISGERGEMARQR